MNVTLANVRSIKYIIYSIKLWKNKYYTIFVRLYNFSYFYNIYQKFFTYENNYGNQTLGNILIKLLFP